MNTLPLFTNQPAPLRPAPSPIAVRRKRIKEAFDHADKAFLEEYERLLMQFVSQGREFTGEDVQRAYKERTHLPLPREWRATGAIYQRLVRQGVIVRVGWGTRNQGNATAVYRSVK